MTEKKLHIPVPTSLFSVKVKPHLTSTAPALSIPLNKNVGKYYYLMKHKILLFVKLYLNKQNGKETCEQLFFVIIISAKQTVRGINQFTENSTYRIFIFFHVFELEGCIFTVSLLAIITVKFNSFTFALRLEMREFHILQTYS